jgi:hypothetical protein
VIAVTPSGSVCEYVPAVVWVTVVVLTPNLRGLKATPALAPTMPLCASVVVATRLAGWVAGIPAAPPVPPLAELPVPPTALGPPEAPPPAPPVGTEAPL